MDRLPTDLQLVVAQGPSLTSGVPSRRASKCRVGFLEATAQDLDHGLDLARLVLLGAAQGHQRPAARTYTEQLQRLGRGVRQGEAVSASMPMSTSSGASLPPPCCSVFSVSLGG